MTTSNEIVPATQRRSAITSHTIGVPELTRLLDVVGADASHDAYRVAVVHENVLGFETDSGRDWRFQTLRRLYQLRPDSLIFRALRDLWHDDRDAQPLLAGCCALASDTVFRATASTMTSALPGQPVALDDLEEAVEARYPGAYAPSTMRTIRGRAAASWQQTGHLGDEIDGTRLRRRAVCRPANVAYAFLLGHLAGARGEGLFETIYAQALDIPAAHLPDLAFQASQRGMLEFRSAGGVTEVGFRELLRPCPADDAPEPDNGQASLLEEAP